MFLKYFVELYFRVCYVTLTLVLNIFVCYYYVNQIIYFMLSPINIITKTYKNEDQFFIFTNLMEILNMYVKVSVLFGFLCVLPFLFFNVFVFVVPGLFEYEKRQFKNFMLFYVFFFLFSVLFFYKYFFPCVCFFLFFFEKLMCNEIFNISFEARFVEYFVFMFYVYCCFIVILHFPLFLFFAEKTKTLSIGSLSRYRGFVLFCFVFVALFFTVDALSQLFLFFVFFFFYEFSLFSIILYNSLFNRWGINNG